MTQEIQKGFQVTSEGEALIQRKNSTEIRFDHQVIQEHKRRHLFAPWEDEGRKEKSYTAGSNGGQESRTNDNQTNKIHTKLGHAIEEIMHATFKNYIISLKGR